MSWLCDRRLWLQSWCAALTYGQATHMPVFQTSPLHTICCVWHSFLASLHPEGGTHAHTRALGSAATLFQLGTPCSGSLPKLSRSPSYNRSNDALFYNNSHISPIYARAHWFGNLPLTHEVPLPIRYVRGSVHIQHLEVQQPAVVCPGAKFQVTLLHVEGEPAHVDVAGALQDARGDVLTVARRIHQHVGVESGVEALIRTEERKTGYN